MHGVLDQHLEHEQLRAALRYVIGTCGAPRSHVAVEIGVADRTLRDFLRGAEPSPQSLRKLWAWYVATDVPADAAPEQAALSVLVAGLPLAERERVREAMTRYLRAAALRRGLPAPRWVARELEGWRAMRRFRRRR